MQLAAGSQVTLFSQSHFHHHFVADLWQKNPEDLSWLTLEAANELKIPYVGYAVVVLPQLGTTVVQDHCMDIE